MIWINNNIKCRIKDIVYVSYVYNILCFLNKNVCYCYYIFYRNMEFF